MDLVLDLFIYLMFYSHIGSDLREKGMRTFLKKVWSVVELCRTEVTNYDLQGSTRVHHHNPNSKPLEGLPFTVLTAQTCNHNMPLTEQHKEERENSVSYV